MPAFSDFRGKTAVVTGGASGMGKGIAQCLIAEGMRVFIADIEEQALVRAAAEIGAIGICADVSDFASIQDLARRVCDDAGTVHVVCNNAGVGPVGRVRDMSIADWRWVLGVNLWGVIHGVQAFLPILRSNSDGGETLAQELAEEGSRIGVTVLCPGPTHTNIKSRTRNRPCALPGDGAGRH